MREADFQPQASDKKMKTRLLVSSQLYFGMDPAALIFGAERTVARIAGAAEETARVNAEMLGQDFQLDFVAALRLVRSFVAGGLLEPVAGATEQYRPTDRFREIATARVVPPLTRAEATQLVDRACGVAERLNGDARNPLFIDRMAVSGSYMSVSERIGKLELWPVVRRRDPGAVRPVLSDREGGHEIRAALRELGPHVVAQVVTDVSKVERPFGVPFEAAGEIPDRPTTTGPLRGWAASLRDRIKGQ